MYLEDWSNGIRTSPDYVFEMMDIMQNSGVSRFMLPDTLGVMSPDEVYETVKSMGAGPTASIAQCDCESRLLHASLSARYTLHRWSLRLSLQPLVAGDCPACPWWS